jgi:hypothetical protein
MATIANTASSFIGYFVQVGSIHKETIFASIRQLLPVSKCICPDGGSRSSCNDHLCLYLSMYRHQHNNPQAIASQYLVLLRLILRLGPLTPSVK